MEQRRGGRNSRRMVVEMFVLGTIASLIGIAIGLAIDWFPEAASTQAGPIDTLWDVLVIVSVPIFVGVTIIVIYAARLFRERPGEEGLDGPPIHGNTKLEVIWTTIPAILLLALCTYAFVVLRDIEEAPASAAGPELRVAVRGEQFAWTYTYAGSDGKKVSTTRLFLPKGRSVDFDVTGKDVIHDFWVPAFRMKVDAVPGITTGYRVTPTRLGTFPVVCAELCGLGHAYMRSEAEVMEPAAFDAWLAKESEESNAPAGGEAEGGDGATASADGKTIFTDGTDNGALGCGSCHQLADAGTAEGIGPNLDEVLPGQTAEEIEASIVDPEAKITPGKPAGVMPGNYGDVLSPAELEAVVTYLSDSTKK
ncbi:MAG: cytochrome c oxidase subunit II [Solirubrobacterales bacterium]|nr:cytochrome c oxidase subunit II [Solirubrobacterales bacterium]